MTSHLNLFTGNSNPILAQKIAEKLKFPLGEAKISRFSDGESRIEILENVRGQDVFIIQSTSAPTNDNLMELLLMSDALRRASAFRVTAVIPYFGYARQDKRLRSARVPIGAKVVADLIAKVGVDRVITVDLHAEQLQGFFSMPVDNVNASKAFIEDIENKYANDFKSNPSSDAASKIMVVSPDIGGVIRARTFAEHFNNADLAIIDKRRPKANESQVMNIIGDVKNRFCVILDDMIDTAGTLCLAAEALKKQGAKKIVSYCTHAVLSGNAIESIEQSPLEEVVVTDTIPLSDKAKQCPLIRQISCAPMLAEVIRQMSEERESTISSLFR